MNVNLFFFDNDGIMHMEIVPPGQTLNGKFYWDILRWLRENIWHKRPHKWQTLLGPASWQCSGSCVACRAAAIFGFYKHDTSTRPTHWTSAPVIFSYSQRLNWSSRSNVLTALKGSRPKYGTWWRCWHVMTSSSTSDHGNATGIADQCKMGLLQRGWRRIEILVSG